MTTIRGTPPADAEIDSFDLAILNIVQENNQLSSHEIGAAVGLSPSAVQRRLRRLRELRVIFGDVALIAPSVAGNRVTIIVEIVLESEQLQNRREFEKIVLTRPEVVQCYYVTGQADYILILTVPSMEAYSSFTDEVFSTNPNIKQFHTAVSMNTVKFTTKVAVEERR